jgi:asparagine synthase (glutamine-hydrolysing)
MCGIIFIQSLKHKQMMKKAILSIQHRGYDDVQVISGSDFSLGHRKLTITGTNSSQPFSFQKYLWSVNGELYDYEIIKEQYPFEYVSDSDSEIIMPLFLRYGLSPKFFDRLNGEFMIVIYDTIKKVLLLIRDRYGVKPGYLYLNKNQNTIIFSSEIKAFKGIVPLILDEISLSQVLSFQYHSDKTTLFKNIIQVPPGHCMIIHCDTFQIKKFSYYDTVYVEKLNVSKNEAIESIQFLLRQAIKRRIPKVPFAVSLSGGIDSCLLATISSEISSGKYFSVIFKSSSHSIYNEETPIKSFLKENGLESFWYQIDVDNRILAKNFEKAVVSSEEIAVNSHVAAKFLLFQEMKKQGVKVSLSGEGSDEIFLGYPFCLQDLGLPFKQVYLKNYMTSGTVNDYFPAFVEAKLALGSKTLSLLKTDFDQFSIIKKLLSEYKIQTNKVLTGMYLWTKICFSNYILNALGDKLEMRSTIEGRVPFLDRDLVNYANDLPTNWKIGSIGKEILRESFPEYSWIRRQKHPFIGPSNLFDCKEGSLLLIELIDNGNKYLPLDKEALLKVKNQADDYQPQLCILLSCYFLAKEYL